MEKTFVMIRPTAVGDSGKWLQRFQDAGLELVGLKQEYLTKKSFAAWLADYRSKPWYPDLENHYTQVSVVLIALEGDDAVRRANEALPAEKNEDGDRAADSRVHVSKTVKDAERELRIFFKPGQIVLSAVAGAVARSKKLSAKSKKIAKKR